MYMWGSGGLPSPMMKKPTPLPFCTRAGRCTLLAILAVLCLALPTAWGQDAPIAQAGPDAAADSLTFQNPLKRSGADPWLTWHDGWYYLTTTTGQDIRMRRATTLGGLPDAEDQVVWEDDTPGRSMNFWAAEFHLLPNEEGENRWYGYYTAAGEEEPSHRMFVIESEGDDPRGPYHFKGQVRTDAEDAHYSIDGAPFRAGEGALYFVWCGRPSPNGQGLFISKMENPWTTVGDRVYLEADGFGCQWVREGPAVLRRNGRIFLIYSMCSANSPDYRLSMLVADENADLTDPASWKQHPEVVFSRNNEAGLYGPGHCYFFKSPDGTEDWIVYHAKTTTDITYRDRVARAQPFTWNADGTPHFGQPIPDETQISEPSSTPAAQVGGDRKSGNGRY